MPPGGTKETIRRKPFKCYIKDSVYTFLCKTSIFSFSAHDILKERKRFLLRKLIAYYATHSQNNIYEILIGALQAAPHRL